MTVEGAVAISAGLVASSIALVGFGLDSAIGGFASLVIVWRFSRSRMFSAAAETRAQKLVAIQFFLLAPYVGVESVRALIGGERPDETWVGIALAASSVILMPLLGLAKARIADEIGSAAAAKGEGRQNMLCAYLAAALPVGLVGNALAGAWWLRRIQATMGTVMFTAIPSSISAGASSMSSDELEPRARRPASAGIPSTIMPRNMATTIST